MGLNPIPLPGAPVFEPGQPLRVAGVLSGTSADGIDVALVELPWRPGCVESARLVAFASVPFEPELAARVRRVLDGEPIGLGETAYLHRDLGLAFGGAVARLGREQDWAPHLVGSHGQTVWHHDGQGQRGPASLQLGDGDFVAEAAGAGTVSDFRQGDMAAGGDGAPLSAYADDLVFRGAGLPLAVLNLGGMGNLSWLDGEKVLAFDTGPAGALLDGLARRLLGQPMDEDGAAAGRGQPVPELVAGLLEHPFLARPLPRSTGRDTFGEAWVADFAQQACQLGASSEDTLRSAAEFVAQSVVLAAKSYLPSLPSRLFVAGGGVHHRPLMAALEAHLGRPVEPSSNVGVDPDAREALVFAVLAARFFAEECVTRPEATGARSGRLLGKWSPAPFLPKAL